MPLARLAPSCRTLEVAWRKELESVGSQCHNFVLVQNAMSGLGFSLSSKRPAPGARPGQPKKPVTVQDLFGGAGSDDEDAGAAKRSRGEPSGAG